MENFITEIEESLAQDLKNDPKFRKVVFDFFLKLDPDLTTDDTESLDMYAYGMALKTIIMSRK